MKLLVGFKHTLAMNADLLTISVVIQHFLQAVRVHIFTFRQFIQSG